MRITLLLVGKTQKGWILDGLDEYRNRLGHYINFEIKELPALKVKVDLKQKEGEMILKSLRPDDRVILLDEHGDTFSSVQWARNIEGLMQSGRNIVYVVGGAFGFSEDVYARADGMISLSRMTFSHQMVRVIFAEQLYRAFTIINGEPYHHE